MIPGLYSRAPFSSEKNHNLVSQLSEQNSILLLLLPVSVVPVWQRVEEEGEEDEDKVPDLSLILILSQKKVIIITMSEVTSCL